MAESAARYLQNLAVLFKLDAAGGANYAVDTTPTGEANAIQMVDVTLTPIAGAEAERGLTKPYMGHQGVILTGSYLQLQGSVELVGAGAAGDAPPFSQLLQACGFAEELTEDVDAVYTLKSNAFASGSLYYNLDGVRHIGLGTRGTLQLSLVPQQIPRITFNLMSLLGTISDQALPAADYAAFIDPVPVNKANTTLSLHGYSAITESLNLDMGGQVEPRMLIGEESIKITGRRATGSVVVQATSLATKNWFSIAQAHTKGALAVQHGTAAGNIVKIDAPKVQIGRPTQGVSQGIANYSLPLMLTPDVGNDELQLTFK